MAVVELEFYEPDGTTLIGTLTDEQLIECEARPALFELGAIRFVVSRHLAEASAALLAKGNIVKVTYPVIDSDPIAAFVLKDDVSQLIDDDEEGGEHLEVTGPGALWILQHARLREEVYAPGQPTRGDWDDDVSWNWRGRPYGAILVRIIEEGQNQPGTPLSEITLDFDRLVDSDGTPWAVIAEDFTVPIGIDVLTVANRLATAGDLYLVLTPDLVLHAYQTYGRDLTGAFAADNVRFEKGVNILTELQRKTQMSRVTHLITRDFDQVYRTFITPDAFDQAVYGFLEVASTNDPDQVEKIALTALSASDEGSESYLFEALPGDDPEGGEYLPGPFGTDGHFWPGDAVTIHTGTGEHDLNAQSVILSAVSIALDIAADDSTNERAARSLRIVPEVSFGVPLPTFSERDNPASTGHISVHPPLLTPSRQYRIDYDCFFRAGVTAYPDMMQVSVSGAGAAAAAVAGEAGHPGIISFSTGTTTTGRAALSETAHVDAIRLGGGRVRFGCIIKIPVLPDVTDLFAVRFGLGDILTNPAGAQTDGVMFIPSSTKWSGYVVESGINETVLDLDIAPVADTWTRLEFDINADATEVKFFVNGQYGGSITTDIPVGAGRQTSLMPVGIWKDGGTTARLVLIDAYWYIFDFDPAR